MATCEMTSVTDLLMTHTIHVMIIFSSSFVSSKSEEEKSWRERGSIKQKERESISRKREREKECYFHSSSTAITNSTKTAATNFQTGSKKLDF